MAEIKTLKPKQLPNLPQANSETEPMTDALLKGLRNGERVAQKALFDKLKARMYAVCLRYMPTNFEAEDVLLTGFAKVFSEIHRFDEKGPLEAWVRRIMVNQALQELRRKRMLFVQVNESEEVPASEVPDVHLAVEDLMQLINKLPQGYRAVFNLYAIEGYSHQEIATLLGISEGTSKSQLSRARLLLQQQLQEVGYTRQTKTAN